MPCHPDACRRCGGDLEPEATARQRHQVWDLPPTQPIIDEYQLFRGHCPCCGITTQANLPGGVPTGQCGPRLAAFTGLLMGHFRQSKRRASMFLGDLLNIPCSPAWTVKIQNLVSESIAVPYEQLHSRLESQSRLFVDESPTREKRKKAWLWVAVAPMFAVFGIFGNRSRESLVSLLGDYSGIIVNCDRARTHLDGKQLQWCWAHLKRDIQKLIDSSDGKVKRLGHDLMREQGLLFEQWRRYKTEEISWRGFQSLAGPIRDQFNSYLLRGSCSGNKKLSGLCNELLPRKVHLWTFLKVEGNRTDQQHGRADASPGGDLSQTELRYPECFGQPVSGTNPDDLRNVPSSKPQRLRVPDRIDACPIQKPSPTIAPPRHQQSENRPSLIHHTGS